MCVSLELDQSRDRTDASALDEPVVCAESVLRTDRTVAHHHALRRRTRESGAEKLSGHGGRRVRMSMIITISVWFSFSLDYSSTSLVSFAMLNHTIHRFITITSLISFHRLCSSFFYPPFKLTIFNLFPAFSAFSCSITLSYVQIDFLFHLPFVLFRVTIWNCC